MAIMSLGFFVFWGAEWSGLENQSRASQMLFHSYTKPSPSPDFSLEDLQGKKVDTRDFRGQVVLLNFWATW